MNPFDENAMMIMLELPDMPDPSMSKRHVEEGPMEGMPQGEAEKKLKEIYCMLKDYFGEECPAEDKEDKEQADEF